MMEVLIGNPRKNSAGWSAQTRILLPHMDYDEAYITIVSAMESHLEPGTSPMSVFTSEPDLTHKLKDYYGIPKGIGSIVNIRTNAGTDFQAGVMANPAANGTGGYGPAFWIGVSADTNPIAVTDVALPGEITTGTLTRAQATFSHTTGVPSYTLTKIFTSDQTVTLSKDGVFNTATLGVVFWEELFTVPRNMASGDLLSVTVNIAY